MRARNYMVVDARRDHAFKMPRPEESVRFGTQRVRPSFTAAFVAGRTGVPGANVQLATVIDDATQPAIVRATALSLLAPSAAPRAQVTLAVFDGPPGAAPAPPRPRIARRWRFSRSLRRPA